MDLCEFKASLVYRASSRTTRDTKRNPVSGGKKKKRQKLGFNMKVSKAKQPATGCYLYLSLKWQSYLQESQNETV